MQTHIEANTNLVQLGPCSVTNSDVPFFGDAEWFQVVEDSKSEKPFLPPLDFMEMSFKKNAVGCKSEYGFDLRSLGSQIDAQEGTQSKHILLSSRCLMPHAKKLEMVTSKLNLPALLEPFFHLA